MGEVDAAKLSIAYAASVSDLLSSLGTQPEYGLDDALVVKRRESVGPNQLVAQRPVPLVARVLAQFRDLVIWILIFAALISGALGEWVDAIAILAIVLLNGIIGFLQEERAEQALAALQNMSSPLANVIRSGSVVRLDATELVPGDLLELEAGDKIPADARLVLTYDFSVLESTLTGESVPVDKDAHVVLQEGAVLAERCNMVYMGTIAVTGKARALVVSTGMHTELGHIAGMLETGPRELTPLQRRLGELGRILIVVCLCIVALIFVLHVLRGGDMLEAFLLAVSLAVAAVPEGLPAVVTIALALGLQRMVKRNALVRRLPSVETLGSVTVICSDKTGTLTRNEMTVQEIVLAEDRFTLSGSGYVPRGQFFRQAKHGGTSATSTDAVEVSKRSDLLLALRIGAWCNSAKLVPRTGSEDWQVIGDPTEGALIVAARKAGIEALRHQGSILYELPFDSTRKCMSVALQEKDGTWLFVKGAPELLLEKCTHELRGDHEVQLTSERHLQWRATNNEMAGRALRVLALAYGRNPPVVANPEAESNLTFVGLVGMLDPPREEAMKAVKSCRSAGIRPVMITGDHPATAFAIASQLGLAQADERALTGPELEKMSDVELAEQVEHVSVYARVTAEHKLRIIKAWKSRGHVVAMTGDGVNDAPAIKAADIGIAMGITGTDVTKEASDMVLIDDNFASIVSAVEEGRGIFDNIQKVVQFLLSCNVGEILLMLIASIIGWPPPLLPIQLLWINLVTDGFPALALCLEPPEPGIMRRRPRRPNDSVLSQQLGLMVFIQGLMIAVVGLLAFGFSYWLYPGDTFRARATTFSVIVYAELFRALAARSQTLTAPQLGFWSNPFLLIAITVSGMLQLAVAIFPFTQDVFSMPTHSLLEWTVITALALAPVTVIELTKKLCQAWAPEASCRVVESV